MTRVRVVHVGVARPSGAYGNDLVDLGPYVDSANGHLETLAGMVGTELVAMSGGKATRAAVIAELAASAATSAEGGLYVLAFTGHGGHIEDDRHGDETIDYQDECWGLDDHPLVDDELTKRLRAFDRATHVAVISNCCFAGGVIDELRKMRSPKAGVPRVPADQLRARQAARRRRWIDDVRALPRGERYASLPEEPRPPRTTRSHTPPNRALAAVCDSSEPLMPNPTSLFTAHILDAVFPAANGVRGRDPAVTYRALHDTLQQLATGLETPSVTGAAEVMERQAFTGT